MLCRARAAYTLTITSFLLILIGWLIPFWFGRFYEDSRSKKQWGLFYTIHCQIGRCRNIGGILRADNVDFGGEESPILLESIPILSSIAVALCILALVIVLIFHCHVCGKKYSYHNYVIGAAIVQFTAATFVFITIILSAISTGVSFSKLPLDDVIEFPWSLLLFCVGEIMLIASAVIYLLIIFHWKKYRHNYAKKRYITDFNVHDNGGVLKQGEPLPDYNIDSRFRFKPYDRNSFIGYFKGSRDDTSVGSSFRRAGYHFPHRSPWDKSRYYYSYPQRGATRDATSVKYENARSYATINSKDHHADGMPGKTDVWHTRAMIHRPTGSDVKTLEDIQM